MVSDASDYSILGNLKMTPQLSKMATRAVTMRIMMMMKFQRAMTTPMQMRMKATMPMRTETRKSLMMMMMMMMMMMISTTSTTIPRR